MWLWVVVAAVAVVAALVFVYLLLLLLLESLLRLLPWLVLKLLQLQLLLCSSIAAGMDSSRKAHRKSKTFSDDRAPTVPAPLVNVIRTTCRACLALLFARNSIMHNAVIAAVTERTTANLSYVQLRWKSKSIVITTKTRLQAIMVEVNNSKDITQDAAFPKRDVGRRRQPAL